MKKLSFILLAIAFTAFIACNSKSSADNKENKVKDPVEKPTVTNGAATTPTPDAAATANLKEHVCTDKCKDGAHVYAHGEKGHTCTEKCMKKAG